MSYPTYEELWQRYNAALAQIARIAETRDDAVGHLAALRAIVDSQQVGAGSSRWILGDAVRQLHVAIKNATTP